MTVPATTRRAGPFYGNGVATSYPFTFKTFDTEDLALTLTDADALESTLVLDSDYSVTLNLDQDANPGGSVTYPISSTPLATGEKLTIVGATDYDQTADLPTGGSFSPVVIENALDRATIQIQQLAEQAGRALTVSPAYGAIDNLLPAPEASKAIGWNEAGTALVNYSPSDFATVVVNGTSYTDIFNGTGAQVDYALTANPGSVNALDISISGVSQVNGVDFTVSGTTLTFTSAPPAATGNICVRYVAALPVGIANAQDIVFDPASGTQTTVEAKLREFVSIVDKGAVGGGADDSAAFYAAAVTGKRVFVPAGTWRCNVLNLPSNSHFFGEGEASIIMPYDVSLRCALGCVSSSASTYNTGITLRDLKFLGTVTADGFLEQAHLLWFNGVKRFLIERCYFEGFRGDGLYLGSGYGGPSWERHNIDVTVRSCVFDGVNNDNRNGISVVDGDGVVIDDCTFRNCARSDMPGSIDFEPDESFGVAKNIKVINCRFYNTDGINAHITFATQNTVNIGNWIVRGNYFEEAGTKSSILLNMSSTAPALPLNMLIDGNVSENPLGNFFYKRSGYCDGITITNNHARSLRGVWFSYAAAEDTDKNVIIARNTLTGVGAASFGVLFNDAVNTIDISGNIFPSSGAYHVTVGGSASSYVSITNNQFIGTPSTAAVNHTSTTKNALTNTFLGNRCDSAQTFNAAKTDYVGGTNPAGADEAALPGAWPFGKSMVKLVSRTIDGASQTGMLYTHRDTSGVNQMVWQEFMPDYSATYKDDRYFRKSVDDSTWDAWWQITGL